MRKRDGRSLAEPLEPRRLLSGGGFLAAANATGAVYDPVRGQLLVATIPHASPGNYGSDGEIDRFDAATGTALDPIRFSYPIIGVEISADGNSAYTLAANTSPGLLVTINLDTGATSTTPYPFYYGEYGGFDLAAGANGKVYFICRYGGSGWAPLHVYDPSTGSMGTVAPTGSFNDIPSMDADLERSADHRYMVMTEPSSGSDPRVTTFNLSTGLPAAGMTLSGGFGGLETAVGNDGTVALSNRGIYGSGDLALRFAEAGFGHPAFIPGTDFVAYADGTGLLKTLNAATGQGGPTSALAGTLSPYGDFYDPKLNTVLSGDGRTAFVPVTNGYEEVTMPALPLPAVAVSAPAHVDEGTSVALEATVGASGLAGDEVQWDTHYDGVTFQMTAGGTSASIPGGDGPTTLRVAARLVRDGVAGPVTDRTIAVENIAPTAAFSATVVDGQVVATLASASDIPADRSAGLTYSFDLDGDGLYETSGATTSAMGAYPAGVGLVTVRGKVTDKDGGSSVYSASLALHDRAVIFPAAPSVDAGGSITLDGSGSATAGAAITKYEWDFAYDGTNFDAGASGVTAAYVAPDDGGGATRTVALRITDADGATAISTGTVHLSRLKTTVAFVSADPIVPGSDEAPVTVRFHNANGVSLDGISQEYLSLSVFSDGSFSARTNPTTVAVSADGEDATAAYKFTAPGAVWTRDLMGGKTVSVEGSTALALDGGALAAQDLPAPVVLAIAAPAPGNKQADLTVALVSPPGDLATGGAAKLAVQVGNIGGGKLGAGASVKFVFSEDQILSEDDQALGSVAVKKGLAGGKKVKVMATVSPPAREDSAAGYLFAVASDGVAGSQTAVDGVSAPVPVTLHKAYFVALSGSVTPAAGPAVPAHGSATFVFNVHNVGTLLATGDWDYTATLVQVASDGSESDFDSHDGSTSKLKVAPGKSAVADRLHITNDRAEPPGEYYFRLELWYEGNNEDDNGGYLVVKTAKFTLLP